MKTVLLLIFIIAGCAQVDYTTPEGEIIRYHRSGPQKLDNVELALPNNVGLKVGGQSADVTESINAITKLVEALK